MPPKKGNSKSPYFKETPKRKSTRVSNTSINSSSRKRASTSSESEFEDGDSSVSDYRNSKRGNKSKRIKTDDSSDEEDSDDEARPPKTVIIPLPKAREAGDTPYQDDRIHENTLFFLKDLKKNNNREWMRFNDEDFRTSQKDFASFIEQLSELVREEDDTVPELPNKDIIFRIYRDVRFSHDQTPYKPHFSAAWSRTGKKGPYAAYYFHLQPGGQSFIGGGLWHPEAPSLERLRDDIDQHPHRLKRAVTSTGLWRDFFKGSKDEKSVIAAFLGMNAENALKTKPRGYEVDHRDIALLRLKNFTISRKLTDSEITRPDGLRHLANLIGSLVPFITYLNSVVMPDPNASDSSDDDDEDDEGQAADEED